MGFKNELQMFSKAAWSWQTWNMNFISGMDPILSLFNTRTKQKIQHAESTRKRHNKDALSQTHPYTRAVAK